MKQKGLTLIEILVSIIILSLTLAGLANIFISGKRYMLHSRSRMTGGELGKYFLDPLQMNVRQDQWDVAANDYSATATPPNTLRKTTYLSGPVAIDGTDYNATYVVNVPPGFGATSPMRKVKLTLTWNEISP